MQRAKTTFLIFLIASLFACGDEQVLPEVAGLQNSESQDARSDPRGPQNSSDAQSVKTQNPSTVDQWNGSFDDPNRFGTQAGKIGEKVSAEEPVDAEPKLATGTLLDEYRYGKLPGGNTNGQGECNAHPRKAECESGQTLWTRGTRQFGSNTCTCS